MKSSELDALLNAAAGSPESRLEMLSSLLDSVAKGYEFRSFLVGIERPEEYSREEHELAFRRLKIELGTRLAELWSGTRVDFLHPELRLDIRLEGGLRVDPIAAPLFIGGRYRKLSRTIPAARWTHMRCLGRGCKGCNHTGNVQGPSLQELAAPVVLSVTGGTALFLHGAGREDVDVRMLGEGRPFLFEVVQPRRRWLDFAALADAATRATEGRAEILRLGPACREHVAAAKSCAAQKSYRAEIEFLSPPPADLAARLRPLDGAVIDQYSPTRVMGRRGRDTLRRKRVFRAELLREEGTQAVLELRTDSGTYIKELVSGDDGRTRPSVAELSGAPCRCSALDVLAVHWQPPWEREAAG